MLCPVRDEALRRQLASAAAHIQPLRGAAHMLCASPGRLSNGKREANERLCNGLPPTAPMAPGRGDPPPSSLTVAFRVMWVTVL